MPHILDLGDTATVVDPAGRTGATSDLHHSLGEERHSDSLAGAACRARSAATAACSCRPMVQAFTPPAAGSAAGAADVQGRRPGPADNTLPAYMEPIRPLLNASVSKDYYSVLELRQPVPHLRAARRDSSIAPRPRRRPRPSCLSGTYMAGRRADRACSGFRRCRRRARRLVLQHLDQEIAFFNAQHRRPGRRRDAQPWRARLVRRGHLAAVHADAVQRPSASRFASTGAWLFSFAAQLTIARQSATADRPDSREPRDQLQRGARARSTRTAAAARRSRSTPPAA